MYPIINTPYFLRFGLTVFSCFFLLSAILEDHHYGFYIFIRIFVFITSLYLAYLANKNKNNFWYIRFLIIAFIYNPIVRFPFGWYLWTLINLITLVFFISSLFKFKIQYEDP